MIHSVDCRSDEVIRSVRRMVIMKVPINDYVCPNLDAPVLPAYEAFVSGSVYWLVWCDPRGVRHLVDANQQFPLQYYVDVLPDELAAHDRLPQF